jgi:hypothetical protein
MINAQCELQGELGTPFEGVQGAFRVSPPIPSGDPAISINMFAVQYWCFFRSSVVSVVSRDEAREAGSRLAERLH